MGKQRAKATCKRHSSHSNRVFTLLRCMSPRQQTLTTQKLFIDEDEALRSVIVQQTNSKYYFFFIHMSQWVILVFFLLLKRLSNFRENNSIVSGKLLNIYEFHLCGGVSTRFPLPPPTHVNIIKGIAL
jgi:hypothetical protein